MPRLRIVTLALSFVLLGMLVACSQQAIPPSEQTTTATDMADTSAPGGEEPHTSNTEEMDADHLYEDGSHQDHDSKHGGTFFMALDNRHHLEGVLDRPGAFRVYIYDSHTEPVSPADLEQTQATVIWGASDGAPEIELKPSADGSCLEASAPGPILFPLTLTLLTRLAGSSPTSRAELFTFPFSHYSHIDATPHPHPPE